MATKAIFEPRDMMEMAVEVMRQSVSEFRMDGQPSPRVGAVLMRPNGSVITAARGELRAGDHAEYTLIERKCNGEKLDRCILFATLEPCLHRNSPKRGCARHIVNARIAKVYVGVEDDNPAVAGKGIEYLKHNGVEVQMFDRDLQNVILEENKLFFEWARRQIQKPEEPIQLSKYEDATPHADLSDLSENALDLYRSRLGTKFDSKDFQRLLLQQGILVQVGSKVLPSGFGLILFGNEPGMILPQARLLARAELSNGQSSRKEFAHALVLVPDEIESWLNQVLPNTVDRSHMKRREQVDLPFEMVREAIINALIHRDYDIIEQKCQLVVTTDTITIKSPGGPIFPITLEQLSSFAAPMKSRNPILHYVFARLELAEEQGYGLTSLKRYAQSSGLPLPSYSMDGDYLVLTIYRTVEAATKALGQTAIGELSQEERRGWAFLIGKDGTTQSEYAREIGVTARTAQRHLTHFIELGLLRRIGRGPATRYLKS